MTEPEIYTLLSTVFSGTAGVYNGELPEGAALPAVTFEFVTDSPTNTLKGDTGHSHNRYTFNAWARTGDTCDSIEALLRSTLSSNIRLARVPLHDAQEGLYRVALDYSIPN